MSLNYSAPEIGENNYTDQELESIELDMRFFGEPGFAPATSLTTAVYALVGALAAGVVVAKKKKR